MRGWVPNRNDEISAILSAAQIETLRHVFEHKNSKQIARIMDVSPHTVDERVRRSLKKLNVSSRIDAAKILECHGIFDKVTPHQSLIYQMASLEDRPSPAMVDHRQEQGARGSGEQHDMLPATNVFPNRWSRWKRWLFWPLLILSIAMLTFFSIQLLLINLGRNLN